MAKPKKRRGAASGDGKKSASRITVKVAAPPAAIKKPVLTASSPSTPRQPTNMCLGCHAPCCDLRVDLTLFDIARIFHMAGKPVEEFTQLAPAEANDCLAIRLNGGLFKLVLRHENGICYFKKDGSLKCEVEDAKPAICLSYPFSLDRGVPYLRNDIVCPFGNLMQADRSKMSKDALKAMFYESYRYEEALRIWNSATNGKEDIARFLKFVSSDLETDRMPFGSVRRSIGRLMFKAGLR